jgi:hypothetical protein
MVSSNNASKWQMGFNWAFKGLILSRLFYYQFTAATNRIATNPVAKIKF